MIDHRRCAWAGDDPLYRLYHDEEWGVPCRDHRKLFELLILEGAQAGLSWITILRKREGYRRLFDGFDAEMIARYDARRIEALQRLKSFLSAYREAWLSFVAGDRNVRFPYGTFGMRVRFSVMCNGP